MSSKIDQKTHGLILAVHHHLMDLATDVELVEDTFEAAVFTLTDIAVLMHFSLDEVIAKVQRHYEVSLRDQQQRRGVWENKPTAAPRSNPRPCVTWALTEKGRASVKKIKED
jgi:hypothetical protein